MVAETFPERWRTEVLRVLGWVRGHRRALLAVVAASVLGISGFGLWLWLAERREGSAGKALVGVNQAFRRQYPAGFYLQSGEGADPPPNTLIERYHQVADLFGGTRSAAEARLRAAHLEYSAGQYDAAIQSYRRYADFRRAPMRAAALLGTGYALEAKGDLAAAAAAFALAAAGAGRDPIAAEAYLAQGRIFEALKKRDEALRAYAAVTEQFPQSAWAALAAQRTSAIQ